MRRKGLRGRERDCEGERGGNCEGQRDCEKERDCVGEMDWRGRDISRMKRNKGERKY